MPAVLLPNGKQQFFTTPGVPAVGYKLATFAAGTSSNQTTWADALKVAANTNPIILDTRGEAVIFWDGAYKVQLQDSTGAVIWTIDNVSPLIASLLANFALDTGAVNAYLAAGAATTAYQAGLQVSVKIATTNTGVSTLNYGGLGIRNIFLDGHALSGGELQAGNIYALEYDGAVFQLLNSTNPTLIRTPAEIAAGVVPVNLVYAPIGQENADMNRYAATGGGDGVTVQTNAFTNALSIMANAVINACRTVASWVVGAVNVPLPAILQGGGKITLSGVNAGFKLNANMSGMGFRDLEVVGDGVAGNLHRMVWNDGTKTISGTKISQCYVRNCIQNIDISFNTDASVIGNRIDSAQPAGAGAGQGYGIVSSKSKRVAIMGNTFFANGRHSIYSSSVTYNVIAGNVSWQNAGTGSSSAYPITRNSTGLAVVGNVAAEYVGVGMSIDADNADGNGTCRAVQVTGGVFYQLPGSANTNADLAIGSSVPATNPLQTIGVRYNSFTPSPVRQNGFIIITNGLNLDLSDNIFDAYLGTVANYIGINLDATGGAAFYDRIRVCGNTGVIASSGGATTFLNVGANICTGTTQLDIFNNTVTCGALISYATTPTNPNIRTDWTQEQAIVLALGAQNLNIAGYNEFTLTGNAGASSITNIVNGYEGKIITIRFVDALVTFTRGNQFLAGAVNFVSANHAMLVLKQKGGNWYEISRGMDG